ncbi:D-xylose-proton symporter [Terfezia boudieri ATCC MYA-4762]|uniref:D-xylose-proton symporter n=1 Tax=Terfezia boudieri ATCC MYA-4762 TaxID=1051890 RepID=A0A3N4LUJ1_9PEZI|nr:D-xylose-proton symporter [Terfezia boudieri ATCC MYA-4762]
MSSEEKVRPARMGGFTGNGYVIGAAIFASMGGFLFGYDQGVMSNILTTENFGSQFPRIFSDADIKGWIVAILQLGAWLGALMNGPIAQKFSRKYSMMIAVSLFSLGSALQAGAQNEGFIFGGRFVAGLAIGMLSHVVPMYQSEISPPEIRGALVSLQQFSITVGILVSFWLDYGFHFIGNALYTGTDPNTGAGNAFDPYKDVPAGGCDGQKAASWRIPLALQIVPALVLGVGMVFFPFSPRWLVAQGRDEEAIHVVAKLRNYPVEDERVQLEFMEIKAAVEFDKETTAEQYPGKHGIALSLSQYAMLFQSMGLFRRLAIGCIMQFFQQFTGINAIIYYAPTVFSGLGLDGNTTSLLATGVVGIVNCVFTIPAILWMDKFGRKKLLIVGGLGMCVCHVIVAAIIGKYQGNFGEHKGAGWAGVAFIYVFIANFAYSWGPIGWVLPSEIFPASIRSKAMSISTSANWMMNFVVGMATPSMLEKIKFGTYIFFAAFCGLSCLWVIFFVPETKNKTLEEMDVVFKDTSATVDADRMRRINERIGLTAAGPVLDAAPDEDKQDAYAQHVSTHITSV